MATPSTSISQPIIFDGTDEDVPFVRFIQQLENSPGWINLTAPVAIDGFESIVPSHLYGDALRYYETLDPVCQDDWSQLRKVMARRFPRTQPKEELDNGSLWTLTQAPPITSSMLARLEQPSLGKADSGAAEGEGEKHKRSHFSLFPSKEKLRALLSPPTNGPVDRPPESLITVHSMFIQYTGRRYGSRYTQVKPYTVFQAGLDESDRLSVAAGKKRPLFTVPPHGYFLEDYEVGFTFAVHNGTWNIDFHHKVLAPKYDKIDYIQPVGLCSVSPKYQWSFAYPMTRFMLNYSTGSPEELHVRRFSIKSCVRFKRFGRDPGVELLELGEITWILEML